MGLFTNRYSVVSESALSDETIYEFGQEITAETGYVLVAEAEENWNKIMKAVGIHELNVLEATGEEVVYEASNAGSFLDKLKDFFKMIWEKIVAVFKKFFAMIDSWIKSDKDFVKKYEKELRSKTNTTDFKFKGYKFSDGVSVNDASDKIEKSFKSDLFSEYTTSTDDLNALAERLGDKLEEIDGKFDKMDECVDAARGAVFGESSLDSKEFGEELFKCYRSGEDSKEEYSLSDLGGINEILSTISNAATTKKAAESEYKALKKTIDDMIKKVDKWKPAFKNGDELDAKRNGLLAGIASKYSRALKDHLGLVQIVNTAKLQALKDENRQAKAICVKLLTYKPKNESVTHYGESGSFLDDVVLR